MPATLATIFPVVPHPLPASAELRAAIVANPVFGE
ncbi:hypothetical protein BKA03_000990 [Demequina lutea]|uniref:Uncharacterized protein n=1 Tax=Demequina lutea TaxID=431489 RepID=A0A7Y9ZCL6_9MICO|nr:hypothetical protein [Demequina lutea]